MNIVVIGHIDHGKSTLIGRLLYDSKSLPESKISEVQKLVEEYKRRFEFGYFLDAFQDELEEERTIDTTRVTFTAGSNLHTVVDVPGHKEFIKNMLTGACNAEASILIVDVTQGIQEQTRRHAYLAKMLGIKKVIVCINKMDLVNYEPLPFEETCFEVEELLKSLDIEPPYIIPISALQGDNIYENSKNMDWWDPFTLIQALDSLHSEEVKKDSKLRIMVQGPYKNYFFAKLIYQGSISKEVVTFYPSGKPVTLDAIPAFPGETLELTNQDDSVLERGDIGGQDIKPITKLTGELVLLEGQLKLKDNLTLRCGTKKVSCQVVEIKEVLDPGTGSKLRDKTNRLKKDQAGIVTFSTNPIVVEKFSDCPELGRFILEKGSKQVGLGIVLSF